MDNSTLGTIYALKHADKSYDEAVIDFWSKYTGEPASRYGQEALMDIAVHAMLNYIDTADNPRYVLWSLFQYIRFDCKCLHKNENDFDDRIRNAIWTTLALTQVRDKDGFVNGFRELEDDEEC